MAGRVMRKEWVKGWRGGEKKGSKAKRGVRKEGKEGGGCGQGSGVVESTNMMELLPLLPYEDLCRARLTTADRPGA